jgi:Peroxidase, family 2
MGPDLAGFLAAYAIATDGDPLLGQWSIGGPLPNDPLTHGLIGPDQGISYSHNVYEGDASIGRQDAYINHGDAHTLDVSRFAQAYALGVDDGSDRYTLDKFVQDFDSKAKQSVANNPYYFAAPLSTTLVSPAAYNFVINFTSNHSAEEPGGYLDGEIFKTFFAVSGDYPNFQWNRGQERIPDNWYRRTLTNTYNNNDVVEDLAIGFLAYPDTFRLGGNTNGVNTYEGVSLTDFTGGAMDTNFLFNPNGQGACFFAQVIQASLPDAASIPLQQLAPFNNLVNKYIKTFSAGFDCPEVLLGIF